MKHKCAYNNERKVERACQKFKYVNQKLLYVM